MNVCTYVQNVAQSGHTANFCGIDRNVDAAAYATKGGRHFPEKQQQQQHAKGLTVGLIGKIN
jgi:hypothetical protein